MEEINSAAEINHGIMAFLSALFLGICVDLLTTSVSCW